MIAPTRARRGMRLRDRLIGLEFEVGTVERSSTATRIAVAPPSDLTLTYANTYEGLESA